MTAVKTIGLLASAFIGVASILSDAHGEAAQDFYRNKQVRLIVGHPVGNDHDVGGRLLAKYLGKYIPGRPNVIVQNMPAAASVAAANYVYGQAPRDGTVMGTFSRNFPSQAMMGQPNIEADPRRFLWLGATSFPGRVCTAWTTAAVKTPADLFTSELIVGGSGAASTLSIVPTVLNHVLGTKFRIVEGYKAAQDVLLAIERGEVQGVCSSYSQFRSLRPAVSRGQAAHSLPRRGGGAPGPAGRADHFRPGQDRGTAPAHALRVFERRVRPALCVPALRAERARGDHA